MVRMGPCDADIEWFGLSVGVPERRTRGVQRGHVRGTVWPRHVHVERSFSIQVGTLSHRVRVTTPRYVDFYGLGETDAVALCGGLWVYP